MDPDVYVKIIDFKITSADELIRLNADGSFTILINARSASNRQEEAYRHALNHIKNNDFYKDSVQAIEYNAHKTDKGE